VASTRESDLTAAYRVKSALRVGSNPISELPNYAGHMFLQVGGIVGIVLIALWLWAIFDSITAPPERIRYLPKALWVLIVLLFADIGAIAWFVVGRRHALVGPGAAGGSGSGGWSRPGSGGSNRGRILAPDDDPDFLRGLGKSKPDDDPRP
jgi:hypothetical protein